MHHVAHFAFAFWFSLSGQEMPGMKTHNWARFESRESCEQALSWVRRHQPHVIVWDQPTPCEPVLVAD